MVNPSTTYHVLLIEEDPKQTELYSDLIREVAICQRGRHEPRGELGRLDRALRTTTWS